MSRRERRCWGAQSPLKSPIRRAAERHRRRPPVAALARRLSFLLAGPPTAVARSPWRENLSPRRATLLPRRQPGWLSPSTAVSSLLREDRVPGFVCPRRPASSLLSCEAGHRWRPWIAGRWPTVTREKPTRGAPHAGIRVPFFPKVTS